MLQLLRPRDAARALGIGLSTFWLRTKTDEDFPKLIRLSPKMVVVREVDLHAYLEKKASVPHTPNPPKARKGKLAVTQTAE